MATTQAATRAVRVVADDMSLFMGRTLPIEVCDARTFEPDARDAIVLFWGDVRCRQTVASFKRLIDGLPSETRLVFALPSLDHPSRIQANALGADRLELVSDAAGVESLYRRLALSIDAAGTMAALRASKPLKRMFSALTAGQRVSADEVAAGAQAFIDDVADVGLQRWIDSVRRFHAGTYQHCVLVSGVAAGYAAFLGFSLKDQIDLTTAAVVHDVGKIFIPVQILEKPSQLSADEREIVNTHPSVGWEHLRSQSSFSSAVLDAVLSHHEFLDGSGYPFGLRSHQISDMTRMITICDVFSALVERRSYKPPYPADRAIQIIQSMSEAGQIDCDLAREFAKYTLASFEA